MTEHRLEKFSCWVISACRRCPDNDHPRHFNSDGGAQCLCVARAYWVVWLMGDFLPSQFTPLIDTWPPSKPWRGGLVLDRLLAGWFACKDSAAWPSGNLQWPACLKWKPWRPGDEASGSFASARSVKQIFVVTNGHHLRRMFKYAPNAPYDALLPINWFSNSGFRQIAPGTNAFGNAHLSGYFHHHFDAENTPREFRPAPLAETNDAFWAIGVDTECEAELAQRPLEWAFYACQDDPTPGIRLNTWCLPGSTEWVGACFQQGSLLQSYRISFSCTAMQWCFKHTEVEISTPRLFMNSRQGAAASIRRILATLKISIPLLLTLIRPPATVISFMRRAVRAVRHCFTVVELRFHFCACSGRHFGSWHQRESGSCLAYASKNIDKFFPEASTQHMQNSDFCLLAKWLQCLQDFRWPRLILASPVPRDFDQLAPRLGLSIAHQRKSAITPWPRAIMIHTNGPN